MSTRMPVLSAPSPGVQRRGLGRGILEVGLGLLTLLLALVAGFGWMYALRALGYLEFGPNLPDALPLLQLAGASAQPLARVVVAWVTVGAIAGVALARFGRPARAVLVLGSGLVLLAFASQAAFAVAHTLNLGHILTSRVPGAGVVWEALLFTAGALLPPTRHDMYRPGS